MKRLVIFATFLALWPGITLAAPSPAAAQRAWSPAVTGSVAGFRLAGIEPDGDPLDQVVLNTVLPASGTTPRLRLVVNTYLENFKPDTTPILPDLLHPNQNAQNLGGFLQGKALLTDARGNALYIGTFIAEAFTDNTNHAVMTLDGVGAGAGGKAVLKGIFALRRSGALNGHFRGSISIPAAAAQQIAANRNDRMRPIKQIIDAVTVKPRAMVGRATAKSRSVPLKTNYGAGKAKSKGSQVETSSGHSVPIVTLVAGAGAVICLVIGLYLFWTDRQSTRRARGSA